MLQKHCDFRRCFRMLQKQMDTANAESRAVVKHEGAVGRARAERANRALGLVVKKHLLKNNILLGKRSQLFTSLITSMGRQAPPASLAPLLHAHATAKHIAYVVLANECDTSSRTQALHTCSVFKRFLL